VARHLLHFALAVAVVGSCVTAIGPDDLREDPEAPVQSSALYYDVVLDAFAFTGAIPLTYHNRDGSVRFVHLCHLWLESRPKDTWTPVFSGIALQALTPSRSSQVGRTTPRSPSAIR